MLHVKPIASLLFIVLGLFILTNCSSPQSSPSQSISVTANAYVTSSSKDAHGAWGDLLEPGMKCIAVSHDLIEMGLVHQTKVQIEGLEGDYLVLDKMHSKWEHKIDIYMGHDLDAALQWGAKKVTISWQKPELNESNSN